VTRKRKASINCEQNESEVKRTTIDYIKHLDGMHLFSFEIKISNFLFKEMKNHYIKSNSNRQTNCSTYSNSQVLNKNQLASKLKVIDFLKDHLYPTGNKSN